MSFNTSEFFMKRCIQLAQKGLGMTYPNPVVGCVIVYDNKIIGEGWHLGAGLPHAEVNAIKSVKDESLLSQSTLYVSLEPCSHHGRTPPCCELISKMKIPKVVIGTIDYNDEVHGNGINYLKEKGCIVEVGVLVNECQKLNKRFFTFHKKARPYIILKWAQTQDGFIYPDIENNNLEKKPIWISNKYSQQLVHQYRTEEQSILVGTNTAMKDNPKLDARSFFGNNPIRLLIDRDLKIPEKSHLLDGNIKTIVFNNLKSEENKMLIYEKINFEKDLPQQICDYLYKNDIQSIIIEGGLETIQSFINANFWDEARVFTGVNKFQRGLVSPSFKGVLKESKSIKNDQLNIYIND